MRSNNTLFVFLCYFYLLLASLYQLEHCRLLLMLYPLFLVYRPLALFLLLDLHLNLFCLLSFLEYLVRALLLLLRHLYIQMFVWIHSRFLYLIALAFHYFVNFLLYCFYLYLYLLIFLYFLLFYSHFLFFYSFTFFMHWICKQCTTSSYLSFFAYF